MPIFEYKCKQCGRKFEELVMGCCAKVKCPDCGSDQVDKLLSSFGFRAGSSFTSSSGGGSCGSCSGGSCSTCGH